MERQELLAAALERIDIRKILSSAAWAAVGRFRAAMKNASPPLTDDQLSAYVGHFEAKLPVLAEAMLSEHLSTMASWLSEQELDLLSEFTQSPDMNTFMSFVQKHSSTLLLATHEVMRKEGVEAHKQSLEAALATP